MRAQVRSVFHLNCTKKIHRNNVEFSSIEISSKKLHRNDVAILIIEVTLNKVCQNDVDFWHIEITSNKVRQNNVDFAPIEITSKKYVEMMWKSIDMFFSMYRRNIDIESVSIRLGVPIA